MTDNKPRRIKTIHEFHELRGLAKPEHPLISVVDYAAIKHPPESGVYHWTLDFYSISLKRNNNAKIIYGQQEYDFDEGIMFFIAPGQVFSVVVDTTKPPAHSGWMLLIHPDFLWNTATAKAMQAYEYFGYNVNEALFLSEKEERTVVDIIKNIEHEYHANIDNFSQNVILAHVDLLLAYSERFYRRQFITRKITNHKVLDRFEQLLTEYFDSEALTKVGLPTVQYLADKLHLSPDYLSGLLKVVTGQTAQQHIHEKLIARAKERLSTTDLSVNEIARELGFGYSQSFNKFFKGKTQLSPLEFRRSFN